jgi:hypothetical protein
MMTDIEKGTARVKKNEEANEEITKKPTNATSMPSLLPLCSYSPLFFSYSTGYYNYVLT